MFIRTPQDFGYRFRELRKKQGLTQVEVAGRAGLKPKTVSGFETGKVCIQLDTLMRLLAVIGAAVEVKDREAIKEFKKSIEW